MNFRRELIVSVVTSAVAMVSTACNSSGMVDPGMGGMVYPSSDYPYQKNDQAKVGSSCKGDSGHLCLALKLVAFKDSNDQSSMSRKEAISDVKAINKVWSQCDLGFQIEEFLEVSPQDYGLQYHTSDDSELTGIRKHFDGDSTLLVVATGPWDRSGSLGNTGANAWTSMPGDAPYGAVLEKPVATFSNIVAHELGHYLGLPHVGDTNNLLNPIIYNNSITLSQDQCSVARSAIATNWQRMLR